MAVNPPPSGMANAAKTLKTILNETVGPMAALGVGAMAFVKAMGGAALNAEKMQAALQASGEANRLTSLFKTIMGSADAARKKVAELTAEAARSPFAFEALGKAALNLQVLSKGAFDSTAALKQVQDVAAATGAPVDAVAAAMGGLAGALKSGGDGVAAAANQLVEMGAISGQTARKIADLAQSGAPASEAMRLLEADTQKAKGAAQELSNTIAGLQQQLANKQMASDADIGKMFQEANEAGARAAIAFQDFTAAVQKAASGPWASIMAGVQGAREAVANFFASVAQLGAVQAVFKGLGAVSVAVLTLLAASLLTASKAIIGFVIQTRVAQAAMAGLIGTTRAWASLMTGVGGALTIVGTGLALLAFKAIEARQKVSELNKELQRSRSESGAVAGSLAGQARAVQTPEDLDAAKSAANEAVANAQKNLDDAKGRLTEAQNAGPGFRRDELVALAQQGVDQAQGGLDQIQGFAQQILSINQAALALDAKRTEEARERAKLEREIAEDARLAAAQMGAGSKEALQSIKNESAQRREDAKVASGQITKGNRAIAEVDTKLPAVGSSDEEKRLDAAIREKEASLALARQNPDGKQFVGGPVAAGTPSFSREEVATMEGEKRALEEQRTRAAQAAQEGSLRTAFSQLQEVEATAPSNDFGVTQTNAQIAQRQLLNDASRQATEVLANPTSEEDGGPTRDQKAAAEALLRAVSELTTSIGGAEQLSGASIQQLEFRRDEGMEKANVIRATQADESNAKLLQAQAVAEAETQYSIQRLRNETMIMQLKKSGAQVAQEELEAQLKAAQALEAAQKAAAAAPSGDPQQFEQAQQRLTQAQEQAANAGVGNQSAAQIEAQLTAARSEISATDDFRTSNAAEAAGFGFGGQRELRDALDELPEDSETVRIAVEASGLENVEALKAALDSVITAADKVKGLDLKLKAAVELEAAQAQVAATPPGNEEQAKQAQQNLKQAEVAAAQAGVGDQSSQEIQAQMQAQAESRSKAVGDMNTQAQIQALRVQEEFGPNRREAKQEADALEDSLKKQERAQQLGGVFSNPEDAKAAAGFQVDMERAMSNIDEMKQPRMSDMASVGGSAGWGGLVQDTASEIKKLQEIASQQKQTLERLFNLSNEMAQFSRATVSGVDD